jgi:hypothetical protein
LSSGSDAGESASPVRHDVRSHQLLGFFERRFLILAAVRLENPSQLCAALLLKQDEQLLHVLNAGSKVHGIDAEPGLALEFGRRYPEFSAPLDSLDYRGVQLLRIVFAQGGGAKADADGRHGRPAGGFEVRMLQDYSRRVKELIDANLFKSKLKQAYDPGEHALIMGLRNVVLHEVHLRANWQVRWHAGTKTKHFVIQRADLLADGELNSVARDYLDRLGTICDVTFLLRGYSEKIDAICAARSYLTANTSTYLLDWRLDRAYRP